jgi:hypothetical protein
VVFVEYIDFGHYGVRANSTASSKTTDRHGQDQHICINDAAVREQLSAGTSS